MHKPLYYNHGYLHNLLNSHLKTLNFLIPISRLLYTSESSYPNSNPNLGFAFSESEEIQFSKPSDESTRSLSRTEKPSDQRGTATIKISHPWPEWVELMEHLLKKGYFDGDRNHFGNGELGSKESNRTRTACLNFARDRYDLIRYLSRKDIHVIAGCGCPSLDRKVINSGKRLRAYVGINEGNVCGSCNLRGNCERAYVMAREDEPGRTVDVMRILLTYGLDLITGSMEKRLCESKMVKESVMRLLREIVEYSTKEIDSDFFNEAPVRKVTPLEDHAIPQSVGRINVPMKQGDWLCPKCNFLNFAKNIKCLRCGCISQERLRRLQEDQDQLPLKKGDWRCDKCIFLNFAKNTRCLLCKEKPPKRSLNPGEWECESCNFINFRRNMVCLKCDHRRPKASNSSNKSSQPEHGNQMGHRELRFVENESEQTRRESVRDDEPRRSRGVYAWRFIKGDGKDRNCSNSHSEESKFIDFPIKGGQSDLSRDVHRRESWKLETSEKRSNVARRKESDDEVGFAERQRRLDFLESTDDDEMADWFGQIR